MFFSYTEADISTWEAFIYRKLYSFIPTLYIISAYIN